MYMQRFRGAFAVRLRLASDRMRLKRFLSFADRQFYEDWVRSFVYSLVFLWS